MPSTRASPSASLRPRVILYELLDYGFLFIGKDCHRLLMGFCPRLIHSAASGFKITTLASSFHFGMHILLSLLRYFGNFLCLPIAEVKLAIKLRWNTRSSQRFNIFEQRWQQRLLVSVQHRFDAVCDSRKSSVSALNDRPRMPIFLRRNFSIVLSASSTCCRLLGRIASSTGDLMPRWRSR